MGRTNSVKVELTAVNFKLEVTVQNTSETKRTRVNGTSERGDATVAFILNSQINTWAEIRQGFVGDKSCQQIIHYHKT